jgi:hypothetical protein
MINVWRRGVIDAQIAEGELRRILDRVAARMNFKLHRDLLIVCVSNQWKISTKKRRRDVETVAGSSLAEFDGCITTSKANAAVSVRNSAK